MITISLPYKTDYNLINIFKQYSIVVRWSYNRFIEGLSQKEIRSLSNNLNNINLLNSWLIQCAIKEGESVYNKNKDSKVIFGGSKNFYRRIKNLISNDEIKNKRLTPLMIQGEETKMGNRSFKLDIINNNRIIFKLSRNEHIEIKLPKLRNNYKKLLYNLENINNIKQGEKGLTYSIRMDIDRIYITFENVKEKIKHISSRYIGIDLNPNEIGISIKDGDKILEVRRYILNIKSNDHNKVKYELFQISKKINNLFKKWNCKFVFIEDLTIKSEEHNKGRKFNKMINNRWIRNSFINNLEKRIKISGGTLYKINPVYSSFIGNLIYNFNDSINASLEVGRRGYDVIILKNKKFYPDFSSLKDQWKEYFNDNIKTWKELFNKIKNLGLKYRVSFEEKVLSHLSHKSGVYYFYYLN
jgi:IS605 OrfB family transposase